MRALLDPGSFEALSGAASDATVGRGTLAGHAVWIGALDGKVEGGSIGVAEARALRALFDAARAAREPLVLAIDSAGARLSEGVAALGAFRVMYRAALECSAARLPMLALIGRFCFGGASMLAWLCDRRVSSARSRIAMSGPGVIAALGGPGELDANDRAAVARLMGGAARAATDAACVLLPDPGIDACRAAVLAWLERGVAVEPIERRHQALGARLGASAAARAPGQIPAALARQLAALFPQGCEATLDGGLLSGRARVNGADAALAGLVAGRAAGAREAWLLADTVLRAAAGGARAPTYLIYDCPGHALTRADEALLLSQYVVHLSAALDFARMQGRRIELYIGGEASGGIYVALAAPASRVIALPGADVRILPRAAVERVLGEAPREDAGPERWVALDIADEVAPRAA